MGIDEHLDWTVTWLNEDVPGTFHRTVSEHRYGWWTHSSPRRVTLGFGAGCIPIYDAKPPLQDSTESCRLDIAGMLTVTAQLRFFHRWFTRFNWNRACGATTAATPTSSCWVSAIGGTNLPRKYH